MFATPGCMVTLLCCLLAVRLVEKKLDRVGRGPPIYLRYWTWLFLLMLCTILGVTSTVADIMLVSGWLDPDMTERMVRQRMLIENDSDSFSKWEQEASLRNLPILRWFSMSSWIWAIATLVTCSWHIVLHIFEIIKYIDEGYPMLSDAIVWRDKTIRILALPMVYCLMSFQAVIQMWGVTINRVGENHHFQSWAERKKHLGDMYASAFSVADVYEAYALFTFGVLIISVLRRRMHLKLTMARCERRLTINCSSGPLFRDLADSMQEMMVEMKSVTILGIKLFCVTCAGAAAYELTLSTMAYYHVCEVWFGTGTLPGSHSGTLQTARARTMAHYFFYGAGFVASFAAIGNIMEVERGFRHYFTGFRPLWKFVGTKIIVSIAFLQSLALKVLPPFCFWSASRANLFYASLLCLECFLISLLHLWAWSASETWYNPDHGRNNGSVAVATLSTRHDFLPVPIEDPREVKMSL